MSTTKMKPIVYIASPYTEGDPAINTHFQLETFHELLDEGLVWPVAPLVSHFLHLHRPRHYTEWIAYDLALLEACDALLRLDVYYPALDYCVQDSPGAKIEVARAEELGLPVFWGRATMNAWAKTWGAGE